MPLFPGTKFNKFTVLDEIKKDSCNRTVYKIQCECGYTRFVRKFALTSGQINRCKRCVKDWAYFLGNSFGKWKVIGFSGMNKNSDRLFLCECSCGKQKILEGNSLKRGDSKGCRQCSDGAIFHGKSKTNTYRIWKKIKERCGNPNLKSYKNYGGRGIQVCKEWMHSFETFLNDMGERPPTLQIDRIDNNDGYYKENCRWVTAKENCNNRRPRSRKVL